MKRIALMACAAALLAVIAGGMVANAGPRGRAIHVISHTVDLGGADADGSGQVGDAVGDSFTSVSEIRDADDETVIGRDRATCSMADPAEGRWHCYGTTEFDGLGSITYQGVLDPTGRSVNAITGGTGRFRGAGGQVVFEALAGDDYPFDCLYLLLA
jgi:hypothetical protein